MSTRQAFIAGIALAALVLAPAATAAPPKPVNVTTPMTRDLDAAGHDIFGARSATAGAAAYNKVVFPSDVWPNTSGTQCSLTAGYDDPTQAGGPRDPFTGTRDNQGICSLYLRQADAVPGDVLSGHGELWFKVGPAATDWQRIAP